GAVAEAEDPNFLLRPGAEVGVPAPAGVPGPWLLHRPGVASREARGAPKEGQPLLKLPQAATPGHRLLVHDRGRRLAGFGLNVPEEGGRLGRVDADIERTLGAGRVVRVGRVGRLRDLMQDRLRPPEELLPWLMLLVLAGIVVESLLANRFYRNP